MFRRHNTTNNSNNRNGTTNGNNNNRNNNNNANNNNNNNANNNNRGFENTVRLVHIAIKIPVLLLLLYHVSRYFYNRSSDEYNATDAWISAAVLYLLVDTYRTISRPNYLDLGAQPINMGLLQQINTRSRNQMVHFNNQLAINHVPGVVDLGVRDDETNQRERGHYAPAA